jgi:hypothetical protein
LDVQRVNWTYVASYLAPNFVWDDYSYVRFAPLRSAAH